MAELNKTIAPKVHLVATLPPNYAEIVKAMGSEVSFENGNVFAYGNKIHSNSELSPDLYVHECVHIRQQRTFGKPELWWKKYLSDKSFRKEQEIEAYREQYWFYKSRVKDRNTQARFLHRLSTELSSVLYGRIVSYNEALRLLR